MDTTAACCYQVRELQDDILEEAQGTQGGQEEEENRSSVEKSEENRRRKPRKDYALRGFFSAIALS